ncbi:hypothetical protein FNV43_RR21994 [Rhamnella rubrinervis]|uniref:Receptor ligand binding region domain-containing protein n=1 Tax=Rhamnella rubrinervis TaxID=2594499 RepID=A0A8K0GMR1_9ROSA|nr:hypothetical protein FNV43_RR21994 [Rhamnella rubrinervis]
MSTFKLPVKVCKDLDSMDMNMALLAKLGWAIAKGDKSFVASPKEVDGNEWDAELLEKLRGPETIAAIEKIHWQNYLLLQAIVAGGMASSFIMLLEEFLLAKYGGENISLNEITCHLSRETWRERQPRRESLLQTRYHLVVWLTQLKTLPTTPEKSGWDICMALSHMPISYCVSRAASWHQLNCIQGEYCWGDDVQKKEEVHVGVIVNMNSREGKIVESCIAMAISDFYGTHHNYTTRVVLHTRDSKGQYLHALSAALELLHKFKVEAIIGAETGIEANFLAEIGNKAELPMVSVLRHSSLPPSNKLYPFLVHTTQDETFQFKGITAIVESFKWRDVVLIHGDLNFERDIISYMIDSLEERNIHITYRSVITTSYTDEKIIKELHKIMTFQTTVFIVHISQHLLAQLVKIAEELGMMSKGYAWVMSATTMNLLHFVDSSIFQSVQGVVGLKSYIPPSKDLHNLTSRLRRKMYIENPNMEVMESSAYGIWAYDSIWAVAETVERTKVKLPAPARSSTYKSSKHGSTLLKEILQTRLRGLRGEFQFKNGRPMSSDTFEHYKKFYLL